MKENVSFHDEHELTDVIRNGVQEDRYQNICSIKICSILIESSWCLATMKLFAHVTFFVRKM